MYLHPVLHSLGLFIIELLNGCLGTNCLINLVHSCLQSFGTQIIIICQYILPIILALCLMLLVTYYASVISLSLMFIHATKFHKHTSFKPFSLFVFPFQSSMSTFWKVFAVLPVHIMNVVIQ